MDVHLIHADEALCELAEVTDYSAFAALLTLDPKEDCDWELTMPEGTWQACPILAGHYVYIEGTEWGGPVEGVRHVGSDGIVRLSGTCWRGLLRRRAIAPPAGSTHVVVSAQEANSATAALIGSWRSSLFAVSQEPSGLTCSARLRYVPLLDGLDAMLSEAGGRLSAVFSGGTVTLSAAASRDMTEQVELSQDYDARLITDSSVRVYNHILALGRGEMLERQVVELWLLADGTITGDPDNEGIAALDPVSTIIYDYSAVEDLDELTAAARRKLLAQAGQSTMEIELVDDAGLQLTDRAAVRDTVTGMTAGLRVLSMELKVSASGASVIHRLGA